VKNYELIEHTADIRIKVGGRDLKELFKNAALAMFDLIAERKDSKDVSQKKIKVEEDADDLEELFINWLNELLSLSATKELIFSDFEINKLDEKNLKAIAIGESINKYKVNTEIKAATYHALEIKKSGSKWQAQVIFDV
jgi:SHS2 domain-containing protein